MIEIDERSRRVVGQILLIIGPGGAGKSTVGAKVAPLLKRRLIDLDHEFRQRLGDIGVFIRDEGYVRYKLQNSTLAADLLREVVEPTLFVSSSGFLTPDNPPAALEVNRALVDASYSICLLPSRNVERTVNVIVERQMARPFARDQAREEATIRARYLIYEGLGDLIVFGTVPADHIAVEIGRYLSGER